MGQNTVAVLLNDFTHEIAKSGDFGKRLAFEMGNWSRIEGNRSIGQSGARIISRDHADGYQVVVVHANFGWRVDDPICDHHFDGAYAWQAFDAMKACLERNGYRVTKKRKPGPPPR